MIYTIIIIMVVGRLCLACVIFLVVIYHWLCPPAENHTNYWPNSVLQLFRFSKPTTTEKLLDFRIKLPCPPSTHNYINLGNFVIGLLLLCGDVVSHPGPINSTGTSPVIKCLVTNAQSLKSMSRIQNSDGTLEFICNL